jgi:hypothetical protein
LKRKSLHAVILDVLLEKWHDGGWAVHYYLQPDRKDPRMLAQVDEDRHLVHLYPHPADVPPEKTGLHELIHIGLDLDGEKHREDWAYALEEMMWRRLTKKHKAILHDMFVKPLKRT